MAGTVTLSAPERAVLHGAGTPVVMVKTVNVADAADGSYPDKEIPDVGGYLIGAYVKPGTTAPTTLMDLALEMDGVDILGGAGADIVTTANAHITPNNTALDVVYAPFVGPLTQKITNNSVNSAGVTIYYFFAV